MPRGSSSCRDVISQEFCASPGGTARRRRVRHPGNRGDADAVGHALVAAADGARDSIIGAGFAICAAETRRQSSSFSSSASADAIGVCAKTALPVAAAALLGALSLFVVETMFETAPWLSF